MASQLQDSLPPTFPVSAYSHTSVRPTGQPQSFQNTQGPTAFRGFGHTPHQSTASQQSNPFRTPTHSREASATSNNIFSPVSPIDDTDLSSRVPQHPRAQRTQHKHSKPGPATMTSEPRKSVDLRKLDGRPYPGHDEESDVKPRKVKVAQDMYAGEHPPDYDRQGYRGAVGSKDGHKGPCHKCGGHKKTVSETSDAVAGSERQPSPHDCQKCGGRKSMPPSSYPRAAVNGAQSRSAPQNARAPPQVSHGEAGPSGHRHKCGKCGRRKRPDSVSTVGSSGATAQPAIPAIQTNGIPVMNIEPPTAMDERAPTASFQPASVSDKPRVGHNDRQQYKKGHSPARSGSISQLFRALSRRKKTSDTPLPSQKLADSGENTPHTFADKISHAIGHEGDKGANYSRLRPDDYVERPGSPFSFVDKPKEEQTFEMGDMRKSKQPEQLERRNSWDKADESTTFLADSTIAERPPVTRGGSDQSYLKSQPAADDVFLALPADQRPGVTRFKSLRYGVNRAADGLSRSASQIGRGASLKRLESVKKVPQFWYRDDMAIEGAGNEYNNYAY